MSDIESPDEYDLLLMRLKNAQAALPDKAQRRLAGFFYAMNGWINALRVIQILLRALSGVAEGNTVLSAQVTQISEEFARAADRMRAEMSDLEAKIADSGPR